MAKTVRLKPGPQTTFSRRCVVCREIKSGPVAAPLPGRGPRSRECVCLDCANRAAEWSKAWRKHIRAWETASVFLDDEPSAPMRVAR